MFTEASLFYFFFLHTIDDTTSPPPSECHKANSVKFLGTCNTCWDFDMKALAAESSNSVCVRVEMLRTAALLCRASQWIKGGPCDWMPTSSSGFKGKYPLYSRAPLMALQSQCSKMSFNGIEAPFREEKCSVTDKKKKWFKTLLWDSCWRSGNAMFYHRKLEFHGKSKVVLL